MAAATHPGPAAAPFDPALRLLDLVDELAACLDGKDPERAAQIKTEIDALPRTPRPSILDEHRHRDPRSIETLRPEARMLAREWGPW